MLLVVLLVAIATLCKEQGITVVAVCATYEIFVASGDVQAKFGAPLDWMHSLLFSTSKASSMSARTWRRMRETLMRLAVLAAAAIVMLIARIRIMGSQLPVFAK